MRELLAGCGSNRQRKFALPGQPMEWGDLVTLDNYKGHKPDVLHDLEDIPWPFDDNSFDAATFYEVIEHVSGRQGEEVPFFRFFGEVWRILKPDGLLYATVPMWNGEWAWGDPGHKRIITSGTLVFLSQAEYTKQVGITAMSDYRGIWDKDFELVAKLEAESFAFVLRAIKRA